MKTLVIAEKPSVARDIVDAQPGSFENNDSYYESEDTIVILSGRGSVDDLTHGVTLEFEAGDVIHVPVGIEHRVKADRASPRLYDHAVQILKTRHYSPRTAKTYLHWIRRYIEFHGGRHPLELGPDDINAFLRAVRFQDIQGGTDGRTHYYGLVADGGAGGPYFMRGKASAVPGVRATISYEKWIELSASR